MWEKDVNIHEVREIRTRTSVFFGCGAINKIEDIAKDFKSKGLDKVIVMSGKNAYKATGAWAVVEKALQKSGIELIRTDIGDKYVSQKLIEKNLLIGGEQCGHIFLRDKLPTGDGILNALYICSICAKQNKKLSEFFDFKNYYQTNINVQVEDKIRIINSEVLSDIVSQQEQKIKDIGRIMIRFSGTEPYIRIMVECENEGISKKIANELKVVVENLNKEYQN